MKRHCLNVLGRIGDDNKSSLQPQVRREVFPQLIRSWSLIARILFPVGLGIPQKAVKTFSRRLAPLFNVLLTLGSLLTCAPSRTK